MFQQEILKHTLKRIENLNDKLEYSMYYNLYSSRCKCNEKTSSLVQKRKKSLTRKSVRPATYPNSQDTLVQTFRVKYEKELSHITKCLLNNFQNKSFYDALDDILYSLKSNSDQQDILLAILYSPILSLHNNQLINFFDIWIDEIYIYEPLKINKFLIDQPNYFETVSFITIKLSYVTKKPSKEKESLW